MYGQPGYIGKPEVATLNGALTSRAYQYQVRPWELKTVFSYEMSTLEYTPILLNMKGESIIRVTPKTVSTWLTDGARYFFKNFSSNKNLSLSNPLLLQKERGINVSWMHLFNCFLFLVRKSRKTTLLALLNKFETGIHLNFITFTAILKGFTLNLKMFTILQNHVKKIFGILHSVTVDQNKNITYFSRSLLEEKMPLTTLKNSKNIEKTFPINYFGHIKNLFTEKTNKFFVKMISLSTTPVPSKNDETVPFLGGGLTIANFDSLEQNNDISNMNVNFFATVAMKREAVSTLFAPIKMLNKSANSFILPVPICYSQEFVVNDILGKKKMQKYSQIFLTQKKNSKTISLIFGTLFELIHLRSNILSISDTINLVANE